MARKLLNKDKAEYLVSLGWVFTGYAPRSNMIFWWKGWTSDKVNLTASINKEHIVCELTSVHEFWEWCKEYGVIQVRTQHFAKAEDPPRYPETLIFRIDYS